MKNSGLTLSNDRPMIGISYYTSLRNTNWNYLFYVHDNKVICLAQEVLTYFRETIWSGGRWIRLERHLKGISDRYSVKVAISYSTTHATRKQQQQQINTTQ